MGGAQNYIRFLLKAFTEMALFAPQEGSPYSQIKKTGQNLVEPVPVLRIQGLAGKTRFLIIDGGV